MTVLLVATAPSHPEENSISEWKPGCYIEGNPIEISFFFCNTGHVNGHFDGNWNQPFFHGPGASFNLTIYDTSERGFSQWGPHGEAEYEELGPSEVRGSGAPDDPFEHHGVFAAAHRSLVVTQSTEYVNGRAGFESHWAVRNASDAAVSFRAIVFADVTITGMCGYGELRTNPRAIGSFTPETGVPHEPNDCYSVEFDRGFGAHAVERADSPWSAYQQGDEYDIYPRMGDGMGPGLTNEVQTAPGPDALAVQWDDHGRGGTPLHPGEVATFSLGWTFSSDLSITPFIGESRDNVHRVTLSTRFARGGPLVGKRIAYEIRRDLGNVGTTRGSVITDERGIAHVSWRAKNNGYDLFNAFFDANGDGKWQEDRELYRRGVMVRWIGDIGGTDRFRSRVTLDYSDGLFRGRVTARTPPDVDCTSHRTVAVRKKQPGRDPTLGSAVSNGRGIWDLSIAAAGSGYYARLLPEWRLYENDHGYRCLGATSSG